MADYWIKLYVEILDDSKMAVLPDRLWRRVIELFLMAGRFHQEGNLPDTRQLAWILRMSSDDLEMDLQQIAGTGIIQKVVNGWFIPKFSKRQAAVSAADRMQAMREKQHHKQYLDENVTTPLRNVTQKADNRLTDTDTDTDTEADSAPASLDPFEAMRINIEKVTGLPPDHGASQAIDELINMKAIYADIEEGYKWFTGQKNNVFRYYSQLVGPTRTAMAKRIQGNNGWKSSEADPMAEARKALGL